MKNQAGFTLIEMALVLAVVGLLVGGGIMALAPLIEKARFNQTNTTLDQVENALVLYAIRNNRLPCPADGSLNNTSATYGLEVAVTGSGSNTAACNLSLANSVVPWRTLGMDEQYSVDGWGNRISYFPANGAITGVNTLVDNTAPACLTRNGGQTATRPKSCDVPTEQIAPSYPYGNYIAVYAAANPYGSELTTQQGVASPLNNADTAKDGNRAAYVLISHGKSGWYGWNKAGHQIAPPNDNYVIKKYNSNASAGGAGGLGFVQGSNIGTSSSLNYFDDIVRWRSPAMIIQLCGSGACGNP